MGQHTIHIQSAQDKAEIARLLELAPIGTYVRFKRNKRSRDQNSRMWAMLSCVSEQVEWHGMKYTPDDWKDWFCHALSGARWMPAENGGMIPLALRTSDMTKELHSDLTALIEAFGANHNVDFKEPEQSPRLSA